MDSDVRKHYHLMMRAYNKLKKIYTDNGSNIENTEAPDAAKTFFINCYHLKDRLKEHPSAPHVEGFINATPHLALLADIANKAKHGELNKKPRSGNVPQEGNKHMTMKFGSGRAVTTGSFAITSVGKEYDALDLATSCVEAWDSFLKSCGIDVSA